MTEERRFPAPDAKGELFLGPIIQGRDSYLLKGSRSVSWGQSSGHEFWQFDPEARIVNYWQPRFDCDCEYGFRTEYELRDFTLLEFFGKTNDSSDCDSWHWQVRIILDVRRRLDPDEPEARAFWQAAARHESS